MLTLQESYNHGFDGASTAYTNVKTDTNTKFETLDNLRELGVQFNEIGFIMEGSQEAIWDKEHRISIETLSLLMPEYDWNEPFRLKDKPLLEKISLRFREDFLDIIPEEGGIIPVPEIEAWINSVRLLILSGQEELIAVAEL